MAGRRSWVRGRTDWIVDILGLYRGTGTIGGYVVVAAHLGCCIMVVFFVHLPEMCVEGYMGDIYGSIGIPLMV